MSLRTIYGLYKDNTRINNNTSIMSGLGRVVTIRYEPSHNDIQQALTIGVVGGVVYIRQHGRRR